MAGWIGINSSNLAGGAGVGYCENDSLVGALNGTDHWLTTINHTHWFILDLGAIYNITKVKGRSETSDDPINVNIYVSETNEGNGGDWGDAVASGISTWQDIVNFAEVNTTPKNGRYIYVVILETESGADHTLNWGNVPTWTIFDVYGQFVGEQYDEGILEASINFESLLPSIQGNYVEGTKEASFNLSETLLCERFEGKIIEVRRPSDYSADFRWDEETQSWLLDDASAGGRYKNKVIIIEELGKLFIN